MKLSLLRVTITTISKVCRGRGVPHRMLRIFWTRVRDCLGNLSRGGCSKRRCSLLWKSRIRVRLRRIVGTGRLRPMILHKISFSNGWDAARTVNSVFRTALSKPRKCRKTAQIAKALRRRLGISALTWPFPICRRSNQAASLQGGIKPEPTSDWTTSCLSNNRVLAARWKKVTHWWLHPIFSRSTISHKLARPNRFSVPRSVCCAVMSVSRTAKKESNSISLRLRALTCFRV